MIYPAFCLLPSHHANVALNAAYLGPRTLGVEVTDPQLSAACALGNIDPQHGHAHGLGTTAISIDKQGIAPCALDVALEMQLPPMHAQLVTLKPDADSLAAMAALRLRASGWRPDAGARKRIALIARWDRWDHGSWEAFAVASPVPPRPATSLAHLGERPAELMALNCLARLHALSLDWRVAHFAAWLARGELPAGMRSDAAAVQDGLLSSWNAGQISIERDPEVSGTVAWLRSRQPGATLLAYRHAPVLVMGPGIHEPPGQISVACWDASWIDLPALQTRLSGMEPGWGGSGTILCSPQGAASQLPFACVAQHVRACLRRNRAAELQPASVPAHSPIRSAA